MLYRVEYTIYGNTDILVVIYCINALILLFHCSSIFIHVGSLIGLCGNVSSGRTLLKKNVLSLGSTDRQKDSSNVILSTYKLTCVLTTKSHHCVLVQNIAICTW